MNSHNSLRIVLVLISLAGTLAKSGLAFQDDAPIKMIRTATLDRVGDAKVTLEVVMSTEEYTSVKVKCPNIAVLMRRLHEKPHWAQIDELSSRFDDHANKIVVQYVQRGMARLVEENLWQVELAAGSKVELIAAIDNSAVLGRSFDTDLGPTELVSRFDAPATARDVRFLASHPQRPIQRITYRMAVADTTGKDLRVDFSVEAKPQIMSCAAKSYANEKFADLWIARSVFRNTGDQSVSDYQVRFRIAGYSDWSHWRAARRVLPNQTVVDPYFPVLDCDKLAQLEASRPVTLEIEYSYRTLDGRTVHETRSRQLRLLGRNEIFYSSMRETEAVGYYDRFDYVSLVIASFASHNDPVMQQLAGGISRLAGGPAPSVDDEDALIYMATLFDYLGQTGIAYQTPPDHDPDGQFGQHIKCGRDVLRNRSGTCIDLAILFASACEAVGLKSRVFVIPGHAFPGVRLPGGELRVVESTMIGGASFVEASTAAFETLNDAVDDGRFIEVCIADLHNQGVLPLDLPAVGPDYLQQLGYTFQSGPAPGPDPPSAYAALTIANPTNMAIHYEVSTDDKDWDATLLQPGVVMRHWRPVAAGSHDTQLIVRFDYTLNDNESVMKRHVMATTVVADPENDAVTSYFFQVQGSELNFCLEQQVGTSETGGNDSEVYAAVTVDNTTEDPVHYSLKWPGGKREEFKLEPGEAKLHWHTMSPGECKPTAHVRFDYTLDDDDFVRQDCHLQSTLVTDLDNENVKTYCFRTHRKNADVLVLTK